MKKIFITYWKWILLLLVLLVIGYRSYQRFGTEKPIIIEVKIAQVETHSLSSGSLDPLSISCSAEPTIQLTVTPQSSGIVNRVNVADGVLVKKGDILFELDNIQQRVALQDAKVALDSAQLALQDLQQENDSTQSGSLLSQIKNQQDLLVEQARNTLFNIDLRAYPKDNPEDTNRSAPQVIGNYVCSPEGNYFIEVYSSSSNSGGSFRYTGLASGASTVSTTNFATPLGSCGLELLFPEDFDKNEDWIVPVPNTQSSQHFFAQKEYEQALENRDIALNKTESSPEQISQQRGRVTQAQLRYQLALDVYEKTRVKAEVSGALNNFNIEKGSFVSAFSDVGTLKTIDQLELVAFVGQSDRAYILEGSRVMVGESELSVRSVNLSADSATRRSKISILVPETHSFTEGEQYTCLIDRSSDASARTDGGLVVPLSALSVIGTDTYVFVLNDNSITEKVSVRTGALLGTDIVVYADLEGMIIRDARGIRSGQNVTTFSNK
jgi:multidrug efflux pump subunit AcrA (membrane-fusion protein)